MEFVESHPDSTSTLYNFGPQDWNWLSISSNSNLTMEYVEAHPEKPWNWNCISMNPNVTMEYIEAHPEKKWNWHWISKNKFKLDPIFKSLKQRKERAVISRFNKTLRLTRTSQHRLTRFLIYHTIGLIYNINPMQISKNLLYFT
jgi:hypothetical protein